MNEDSTTNLQESSGTTSDLQVPDECPIRAAIASVKVTKGSQCLCRADGNPFVVEVETSPDKPYTVDDSQSSPSQEYSSIEKVQNNDCHLYVSALSETPEAQRLV